MTKEDPLSRWINLFNLRGIAGEGARETEDEKKIVERSILDEFTTSLGKRSVQISNIIQEEPPLPDFSANLSGNKICIELTEFIDQRLLNEAKYIKKTQDHHLNNIATTGGLWFNTDRRWFHDLLRETVEKKDRRYQGRQTKIDVLLLWNEALQVGIEDTDFWIEKFELPELNAISSIYFQSWYHPNYVGRPTWSIKPHHLIGEIKPTHKEA